MISLAKTKRLLKNYCHFSYRKPDYVNSKKITPLGLKHRENFIRLFLQYGTPHNFENVISIDETSWNSQQMPKRLWGIKGQPEKVETDAKGKSLTLLCAISIHGIEDFMIIQGGDKQLLWCYFINEVAERYLKNHTHLKKEDLLLVFDNAACHVNAFAGWWNR